MPRWRQKGEQISAGQPAPGHWSTTRDGAGRPLHTPSRPPGLGEPRVLTQPAAVQSPLMCTTVWGGRERRRGPTHVCGPSPAVHRCRPPSLPPAALQPPTDWSLRGERPPLTSPLPGVPLFQARSRGPPAPLDCCPLAAPAAGRRESPQRLRLLRGILQASC